MDKQEKFVNPANVAALWDTFKDYLENNAATTDGSLKLELDKDIFGEPPYTLEFTEEDYSGESSGGGAWLLNPLKLLNRPIELSICLINPQMQQALN